MSIVGTLTEIANHLYYLKITRGNNIKREKPVFSHINCVCNAITVIGETKYNEENFNNMFGVSEQFYKIIKKYKKLNKNVLFFY